MTDRIHVLMERAEKERYRRLAAQAGKSLSEWLREAAAEKASSSSAGGRLDSADSLRRFFAACDARESREETDWKAHRRVIERSKSSGQGAA